MFKEEKAKQIPTRGGSAFGGKKEENWLDDLMERQEHDLEVEEEILSSVPSRLKHKYLDDDKE